MNAVDSAASGDAPNRLQSGSDSIPAIHSALQTVLILTHDRNMLAVSLPAGPASSVRFFITLMQEQRNRQGRINALHQAYSRPALLRPEGPPAAEKDFRYHRP